MIGGQRNHRWPFKPSNKVFRRDHHIMAATFHIDKTRNLAVFKVTEVPTYDDLMTVIEQFYAGKITRNVLWDFSEITDVGLTSKDIEKLAEYSPRYEKVRPNGRTALVASSNAAYGMARMFSIFGEVRNLPYPVMTFRTLPEAYAWLEEDRAG